MPRVELGPPDYDSCLLDVAASFLTTGNLCLQMTCYPLHHIALFFVGALGFEPKSFEYSSNVLSVVAVCSLYRERCINSTIKLHPNVFLKKRRQESHLLTPSKIQGFICIKASPQKLSRQKESNLH